MKTNQQKIYDLSQELMIERYIEQEENPSWCEMLELFDEAVVEKTLKKLMKQAPKQYTCQPHYAEGTSTKSKAYTAKRSSFSGRREAVFNFIRNHPGCTRRQITTGLNIGFHSSITARVTELLVAGMIYETGTTVCETSGMTVATLKVVGA